ncbi:PaaI family thioesterase [Egicoccus sp. AB-alg2]|uniref:PaaI family thioesterase n=1 Tax=Egicoccus sp. AB-alg2 TaxID=3242693 RepID=UPI00359CDCC9
MTEAAFETLLGRLQVGETVAADELEVLEADRFASDVVGLRWDTLSLERVTAHLDVDERHHQPYGIVHGGVWCAVVETIASIGAALHAASNEELAVGVSNTTDFLRPHRQGRVLVEGVPLHVGRTQQLWQVVVSRESDGKPVARGQVRVQAVASDQVGG